MKDRKQSGFIRFQIPKTGTQCQTCHTLHISILRSWLARQLQGGSNGSLTNVRQQLGDKILCNKIILLASPYLSKWETFRALLLPIHPRFQASLVFRLLLFSVFRQAPHLDERGWLERLSGIAISRLSEERKGWRKDQVCCREKGNLYIGLR